MSGIALRCRGWSWSCSQLFAKLAHAKAAGNALFAHPVEARFIAV
jgi:hypothetical protein